MKVEDALNEIQYYEAIPVLEWRGYVFHIDIDGRKRGQLHYTKFEKDLKTPIHSVKMPYSKTHTLGEVLDRGEGLQKKIDPLVTELPATTFSIIQCTPTTVINKNV